MRLSSRADYVSFVEESYFGAVARGDIDATLRCFSGDAQVTIYHGDAPARRFRAGDSGAGDPIRRWYEHLLGNFEPRFSDFRHYVDVERQRCASTFLVTLRPRTAGHVPDAGTQRLRNCNFFDFRDGLIERMLVYYANPDAAATAPTGYPPASA